MPKIPLLAGLAVAFSAAPAFAQSTPQQAASAANQQAPSAASAGAPAAALVAAPAVGVVVDPATHTAVVVPVNPNSDVPPEATALLKGLYETGQIRPGQVVNIIIRRGNQVTELITNAPRP
jgi:hypothetical protein